MSKKKFRFIAPFNTTGYGIASIGYAKGLLANNFEDFTYHVIGTPQLNHSEFKNDPIIKRLIDNHLTSDVGEGPAFVFWHFHALADIIKKFNIVPCNSLAFSTFEVDTLKPIELQTLSNFIKVGTAAKYYTDILKSYRLNTINAIPHAYHLDDAEIKQILSKDHSIYMTPQYRSKALSSLGIEPGFALTVKDVFISVGKYESRKGFKELLNAFILNQENKNGNKYNEKTVLISFWHNPFIPSGFPFNIIHELNLECVFNTKGLNCYRYRDFMLIMMPPVTSRQDWINIGTDLSATFIAPSKAEGWNLPLFEALSNDIPAIATNIGGHLDYTISNNKYHKYISAKEKEIANDNLFFHGESTWNKIDKNSLIESIYNKDYIIYSDQINIFDFSWQKSSKQIIQEMTELMT